MNSLLVSQWTVLQAHPGDIFNWWFPTLCSTSVCQLLWIFWSILSPVYMAASISTSYSVGLCFIRILTDLLSTYWCHLSGPSQGVGSYKKEVVPILINLDYPTLHSAPLNPILQDSAPYICYHQLHISYAYSSSYTYPLFLPSRLSISISSLFVLRLHLPYWTGCWEGTWGPQSR